MNVLLLIVVVILAGCIVQGYTKGFLRVLFRLAEGILVLLFVAWATPHVAKALESYTTIDTKIEERCNQYLHSYVEKQLQETEDAGVEKTQEVKDRLEAMGVTVPEGIINQMSQAGELANQTIEDSGVYEEVSKNLTNMAMRGIALAITLLAAVIVFQLISNALGIIDKIPLIGGVNQLLGLGAGAIEGLLVIWVFFALIALTSTTGVSSVLMNYIKDSEFLLWIYENNVVLTFFLIFF